MDPSVIFLNQSSEAVSAEDIEVLEKQGNTSNNWNQVRFQKKENIRFVSRCSFNSIADSKVIVGQLGEYVMVNGCSMKSELKDSNFYGNCYISNNCVIVSNNIISNTFFGDSCVVIGCGQIKGPSDFSCFGNYQKIKVGSENGGREVCVDIKMNYWEICEQVYSKKVCEIDIENRNKYQLTIIEEKVILLKCDNIIECFIGKKCNISNSNIYSSTLQSLNDESENRPITISSNSFLKFCLVQEGCVIENNCFLENVFMSESSSVGINARVCESILSPDSQVCGGECHRSLVGPFIGFHHCALLIASLWPAGRGNIAYGAKLGANHTDRTNDQEFWPGEGCFFGLGCSIKFPSNLCDSPYSIIAPDTCLSPQLIKFPFSLVCNLSPPLLANVKTMMGGFEIPIDACVIKPGWILYANPYMLDRATSKFTNRRKAKNTNTSFPVLRPTNIKKIINSRNRIESYLCDKDESYFKSTNFVCEKELPGLGRCIVSMNDLKRALNGYNEIIKRYALHGFLFLLSNNLLLNPESSVYQISTQILQSLNGDRSSKELSLFDEILFDLQHFNPNNFGEYISKNMNSCFLQDSNKKYLNDHQLFVLFGEYKEIISSFINNQTKEQCEVVVKAMLTELTQIEINHSNNVSSCRKKDAEKGVDVIPDYSEVNAVAINVENDEVVAKAILKAKEIQLIVENIFDKM